MITALVGAQYGSEGKGAIAHYLSHRYEVHVRTGGPNAGHTIIEGKQTFKMRSLPCGWVNSDALLIIGAGAIVDLDILAAEVKDIEAKTGFKIRDRLYIDEQASVLSDRHRMSEGGVLGKIHSRIGSTGTGTGACRLDRMARDDKTGFQRVVDATLPKPLSKSMVTNTVSMLAHSKDVLLEGTQGFGLSLIHGPWPYTTSVDSSAAQLCQDAGISPLRLDSTILVARTFPIRVAGNSGPLKAESSWEDLGFKTEYTTVTKKPRRIGGWDDALFGKAVQVHRGKTDGQLGIALTFLDYVSDAARNVSKYELLPSVCKSFITRVEHYHGVDVVLIGTGPDTVIERDD